jgi:SAM-dependent methyltransferase
MIPQDSPVSTIAGIAKSCGSGRRHLERFYGDRGYPQSLAETTRAFPTADEASLVNVHYPGCGVIVDLGCGDGRHLEALRAKGMSAIGVDLVLDRCIESLKHGPTVCADVHHLPFLDGSAGIAYSLFTSFGYPGSHLELMLWEVRRMLRDDGSLLFQSAHPDQSRRLRVGLSAEILATGSKAHHFSIKLPTKLGSRHVIITYVPRTQGRHWFVLRYKLLTPEAFLSALSASQMRGVILNEGSVHRSADRWLAKAWKAARPAFEPRVRSHRRLSWKDLIHWDDPNRRGNEGNVG